MKCLLILLLLTQTLYGQQLHFDQYDMNAGLVNNEVKKITQSPSGVLYFGTPNGISCFDGGSFFNYNARNGFTGGFLNHIEVVNNDSVLFFPSGASYYALKGRRLMKKFLPASLAIRTICKRSNESYYAATNTGLYIFDKKGLMQLPVYEDDPHPDISALLTWQDSLLIVGRLGKSFDVFNRHTWKRVASFARLLVRDLYVHSDGALWIATIEKGVQKLSPAALKKEELVFDELPAAFKTFAAKEFRSIAGDRKGNLWMATISSGLLRYNPSREEFQQIGIKQGLLSNTVFCVFTDREDNTWIGTNNGVQKLVQKDIYNWSSADGLPADLVLDIAEANGNLYTTGYYGIGIIRKDRSAAEAWNPFSGGDYAPQVLKMGNDLYFFWLHTISRIKDGPGKPYFPRSFAFTSPYHSATVLGKNRLLLAGDHGVYQHSDEGMHQPATTEHPVKQLILQGNRLFVADNKMHCRIYAADTANEQTRLQFLQELDLALAGTSDGIFCLAARAGGGCFAGTAQQGIIEIGENNGRYSILRKIDIKTGLSSNSVRALLPWNDSVLYAGTGTGLGRVTSREGREPIVSDLAPGYASTASIYCIKRSSEGGLLLGTESGLVSIPDPAALDQHPLFPPVLISAFSLIDHPDSIINTANGIRLSHRQNAFTISFASPSFINEKATRYRYWLKGSNQADWSAASTNHSITFSNLAPGEYSFWVKTEEGADVSKLSINIKAPFWQRWWFYGLLVLAVAGLSYMLYRYRLRQMLKVEKLRQKISTDLHDDIGATLTGVGFLTEMARARDLPEDKRQQYLATAAAETKNISERLGDIVWSINPQYDKLEILLYKMRRYAGELLESKGIRYEIELPENESEIRLGMENRQHLYLIFKEALNNIIKYAQADFVSIKITRQQKELCISIIDNGIGFDASRTEMGNGIGNMQYRAKLAGGHCTVRSTPGKGTEVLAVLLVK